MPVTNSIHHAGLPCVRFNRNDILEAVQGDHSNTSWPDVHNLLHLFAHLQQNAADLYIDIIVFNPLLYSAIVE